MNKKYVNQISALLLSSAICAGTAGSMSSVVQAADYVKTGKAGEYSYEVYNMFYKGDVVFDENDVYSCSFSDFESATYMLKKKFTEHSIEDYGKITLQYDAEIYASAGYDAITNVFFGLSGWAKPGRSMEVASTYYDFYVVDGWADWRPPGETTALDTVEIDGVLYDIYKSYRISNPGIHGTDSTSVFWSVRRDNLADGKLSGRVKGTVNLSEHMKAWEKFGFDPSAMMEAGFYTEGYRSGMYSVKINSFDVTTDFDEGKPETNLPKEETKEPETNLPEEDAKEPDAKLPEEDTKGPAAILPGEPAKESEEKSDSCVLKGDCDNNGTLNTADYLVMKKYLLGLHEADIESASLDMDGNGKVNIADYILLRRMLLDLT